MKARHVVAVAVGCIALGLSTLGADARGNKPCSKSKGGVKACQGGKFLCNDGSISASKRKCGG